MKYIKLFESFFRDDSDFVVTKNTTAADLEKALDKCFEKFENGGGSQTIVNLFLDILYSSLKFARYDENDAEEICDKLEYRFKFPAYEVKIDDEILFKYTNRGDGSNFKVTEYDPEVILNIIKVILEEKLNSESIVTYKFF